jgi:hypothetical protein
MPRPRKQTALEDKIAAVIASAAREIAAVVRSDLADQLQLVVAGQNGRVHKTAASTNGKTGKRGRRSSLTESVLSSVLSVIEGKPGLRSEQIQAQLRMQPKMVKAALAKLREQKQVKTTGQKRSMTYASA